MFDDIGGGVQITRIAPHCSFGSILRRDDKGSCVAVGGVPDAVLMVDPAVVGAKGDHPFLIFEVRAIPDRVQDFPDLPVYHTHRSQIFRTCG